MNKLQLIDADTLYYKPLAHPKMLIDGVLSDGLAILAGDSKIGKSWMVLWLCLQISRGEAAWGLPTRKTDVVYLALEDREWRVQQRMQELTDSPPENLRFGFSCGQLGAELVPFSPLTDERLPNGVQGLYLGGGYPELYAAQLEENHTLRRQIRDVVHAGMPCIAECGGFMYLTESIAGHAMVGALPGDCFDTGKLTRCGYITATAQEDSLLCRAGEQVPMHEFHHWDTPLPGSAFLAEKPSGKQWRCAYATDTLYAGFPHFHFYAKPVMAQRFLAACRKETLGWSK